MDILSVIFSPVELIVSGCRGGKVPFCLLCPRRGMTAVAKVLSFHKLFTWTFFLATARAKDWMLHANNNKKKPAKLVFVRVCGKSIKRLCRPGEKKKRELSKAGCVQQPASG